MGSSYLRYIYIQYIYIYVFFIQCRALKIKCETGFHNAYWSLGIFVKDSTVVLRRTTLPAALLLCGWNSQNNGAITVVASSSSSSSSKTSHICMRIRTCNICINIASNICMSITFNIYKINTTWSSTQGAFPLGDREIICSFCVY